MKILLIGDCCTDIFVEGDAHRLSPERPVPVFIPVSEKMFPGMGGNVLANLQSLCPEAVVSSIFPNKQATKTRFVERRTGHHFLRVDSPDKTDSLELSHIYQALFLGPPDAFVVSDYAKGAVEAKTFEAISNYARENLVPVFLDSKSILGPWAKGAILKINQHELEANLSAGVRPWEHVSACIVTYGADGMKLHDPHGMIAHEVKGPIVEVRDGAGCGDSVLAALVIAYLENGYDIKAAMEWADKVGRVAVSKRGIVAVKREEVL